MKLHHVLMIVSLLIFSGCQKDPATDLANKDTQNPQAGAKDSKKTAQLEIKSKMNCTSKEIVKIISAADDKIIRETIEEEYRSSQTSRLTSEVGNTKTYILTGDFYSETFSTMDGSSKKPINKIDYTFEKNSETETNKLNNNEFESHSKSTSNLTGRNGYQFINSDKTKSDIKKTSADFVMKYFDDGATYYVISVTNNKGSNTAVPDNETTKYKTEGKITKSVKTLKEPRIIKNKDGVIIQETEFFEENCTEEALN